MGTKCEALITSMELAREELNHLLEKVTPQTEIYPSWKVKQLLDHITGWDELMISVYQTHAQGGTPGRVVRHGINSFNEELVSAREGLSIIESRKAFNTSRAEVIQALRDIPPERLDLEFKAPWPGTCTVEKTVKILVKHEKEHARHIREILKNAE